MDRSKLKLILLDTLESLGGSASILEICRFVWRYHLEETLTPRDKAFYTWQYDIRWAATILRKENLIKAHMESPRGIWQLVNYIRN